MRLFRIVPLVVSLFGLSFAGMQIGLDFNFQVNPTITTSSNATPTQDTRTESVLNYGIHPYIGIRPGALLEIAPSINFQYQSGSTEIDYTGSQATTKSSYSQLGLGLGIAFLFHIVRNEYMELGFGPELSGLWWLEPSYSYDNGTTTNSSSQFSSYYRSVEKLALPLKFDFYFSKNIGVRMNSEILALTYSTHSYEYKNADDDPDVVHDIDFSIITNWVPTLGLFIRF